MPQCRTAVRDIACWRVCLLCFRRSAQFFADAGHESRKLARELMHEAGWKLQITRRGQRAFQDQRAYLDRGA